MRHDDTNVHHLLKLIHMLHSPFSVITMMVIHLITYCMYVHNQKLTTSFNSEAKLLQCKCKFNTVEA